jgi:hypothetical protein
MKVLYGVLFLVLSFTALADMPWVDTTKLPVYVKANHNPGTMFLEINRNLAVPSDHVSKARIQTRIVQVGKIDPIYWPGVVAPHIHDILSIRLQQTDTVDSLLTKVLPSAASGGDWWQIKSFYPSLVKPDGTLAVGTDTQLYYLVSGLGKLDKTILKDIPKGLVIVTGNSKAKTIDDNWAYKNGKINFFCLGANQSIDSTGDLATSSKFTHKFPKCPTDSYFVVFTEYQNCWDGVTLFDKDMKNLSFGGQPVEGKKIDPDTTCPVGWVNIPALVSRRTYLVNPGDDTSTWSNSSDTILSSKPNVVDVSLQGVTAHGDLIFDKVETPIDFFQIIHDKCWMGGDCGADSLGNGVGFTSARKIYNFENQIK